MSLKPYKGADLHIMALMPNSESYILLDKRKHNPRKGAWSFPGGKK